MAKLKRFRLVNIQSWDQNSDWVELDDSTMNIIIGRNETGKSVLYKVLAQMFIPSQFGSSRKDLIRDGFSYGLAMFELDTGVIAVFKVNVNNTQEYQIIYPDGRKLNAQGDEPPQELAQEFNWFVDVKEGVILNLLHKDTNLPFIRTSKTFNAQLMKFLNEDPRVESIRNTFMDNVERIKDGMKSVTSKIDKLRYRYDAIEYIDVASKREVLQRCLELQDIWAGFMGVLDGVRTLATSPEVPPRKYTAPEVVACIELMPSIVELGRCVESLNYNLSQVPDEKDYSKLGMLQELAKCEAGFRGVVDWGSKLWGSLDKVPDAGDYQGLAELESLAGFDKISKQLIGYMGFLFKALQQIPNPEESERLNRLLVDLSGLSSGWKSNHQVITGVAGIVQGLIKASESEVRLKQLEQDIQQMQEELKVCPTCGKSFKGG